MITDKLLNLLESYDSIPHTSSSIDKCNDLLSRIINNESFDITKLNPNRYQRILQCRSKEEKDDFRQAQDVAMTIETLNNFQKSKNFQMKPISIHEYSEDINQRFSVIQDKVYSIVYKETNMK